MVLENSSTGDDAPPGDSNLSVVEYKLNTDNFPKPIPIFGTLFGFNEDLKRRLIERKITVATQTLQRPPTTSEAHALAYWSAKAMSIYSYGPPIGVAGGLWRCYDTRKTFRFPLWQPKIKVDQFPPMIPLLTGPRAALAWHMARMTAYGTIGNMLGQAFFGVYAASIAGQGEATDPRLKELGDANRQRTRERLGGLSKSGKNSPTRGREINERYAEESETPDDASPSGGNYGNDTSGSDQDRDIPILPDRISREAGQYSKSQWPVAQPVKSVPQYDDSSPTGGSGVQEDIAQDQGSAWDRIRRGASTGVTKTPTDSWPASDNSPQTESAWSKRQNSAKQEGGLDSEDGYSFSTSEAERHLAKQEAQKEFDAKVERERRGGDFSSNGGDQRRW